MITDHRLQKFSKLNYYFEKLSRRLRTYMYVFVYVPDDNCETIEVFIELDRITCMVNKLCKYMIIKLNYSKQFVVWKDL